MSKYTFSIWLTIGSAFLSCACKSLYATDDPNAAARATLQRIQALRKERPNDGVLIYYEAAFQSQVGERARALELLRSLKGRKLGLIPTRDLGFDAIWDNKEFQMIRKELADEEAKTPDAPVAFRLKDPKLIPEGIAYDPTSKQFFLGSIAQHKIIVTDAKGEARDFSAPGDKLDAVLGLAVDAARGHLYAVSTNGFEDSGKIERRNAIMRYDLKDERLTDRFLAPEAMQLNDVAIAPDGTVYTTDSASGTVFRKKPDERTFTRLGATGGVRGANGITFSSDGILYVTLSTGIARVDTGNGAATRLPQPDTVVTGGIDGLYWHDGDLFGIQNSTNPGRVVRIALADKGSRIAGLTVLQSHQHPDFDEPTTGAIAKSALNVIGNSYVSHYQADGSIKDAAELKGTAIVAVPLGIPSVH
jgi:SMP-30/Gluconolactonase/LRE-like region